jgi:hypothetical protein
LYISVQHHGDSDLLEGDTGKKVEGCTVPQALRLAMLRLARRPVLDQPVSEQDVADGLKEAWKRPMHWAVCVCMCMHQLMPVE